MQKIYPKASNTVQQIKVQQYISDGKGRDKYIGYNQGGLYQTQNPIFFKREHSTSLNNSPKNIIIKPFIPPKIKHYHADGTGRDKYIKQDEGGFLKQKNKKNYISSLRSYPQSPPPTQDIFSSLYTNTNLPHQNSSLMKQIQQDQCERLSRPNQLNTRNIARSLSPQPYQEQYNMEQVKKVCIGKNNQLINSGHRSLSPKNKIVTLNQPYYPLVSKITDNNQNYVKQQPTLVKYYRQGKQGSVKKLRKTIEELKYIDNVTD